MQELGTAAKSTPRGRALARIFKAAGGPVLLLFDEVLNFSEPSSGYGGAILCLSPESDCGCYGYNRPYGVAVISLPAARSR